MHGSCDKNSNTRTTAKKKLFSILEIYDGNVVHKKEYLCLDITILITYKYDVISGLNIGKLVLKLVY